MKCFLLDTNIISEVITPCPHPHVVKWFDETAEELLYLSVLTLGEIRKGISLLSASSKKVEIEVWLEATNMRL